MGTVFEDSLYVDLVPRGKAWIHSDVPDDQKAPRGWYRQAPKEYGSVWMAVYPFARSEPWLRLKNPPPGEVVEVPDDFIDLFKPVPVVNDFLGNHAAWRDARSKWEQDLGYFGGVGLPDGTTDEDMLPARDLFADWNMGRAVAYRARYSHRVRWPDANPWNADFDLIDMLHNPDITVGLWQIWALAQGIEPTPRHALVPPQLWPDWVPAG